MNVAMLMTHHTDSSSTLAAVADDMVANCEHLADFLSVNFDCAVCVMCFGCRNRSSSIGFPATLPSLCQCNSHLAGQVRVHFAPYERDEVVVVILVFDEPTAVAVDRSCFDANVADSINLVDIGTVCVAFVHADAVPFVVFPHEWHATMAILVRSALVTIAIG